MARRSENAERPAARDLRRLRDLLAYLRPYRWRIAGAGIALLVAAGTVLGLGWVLRHLIDSGFGLGNEAILDRALLLLFGATVLLALSTYARFYLVTWLGERVIADIRKSVFDHLLSLSPGFFETTRTGEILSRLTADTTLLQTVIGSSASVALRNAILMIGGFALLAITSPRLTLLILIVVPVVVAPIVVFGRRLRNLSRQSQDQVAAISADAGEVLYGIRTVQAFAREEDESRRFADRVEQAFAAARRRFAMRAFLTALVILLVFGAISILLWLGGADVLAGRLSAGQLSAFVFYAILVAGSVGAITEVVSDLQHAAGAMGRIRELLAMRPEIAPPAHPLALPAPLKGEIAFSHVGFRYPTRPEMPALEDVSLAIAPGETIAIVGPSGAGKTTILHLLMRFYDVESGRITLDGQDIRDFAPADLRSAMGLVPQDPVIFSGSALDNIRYGRPTASEAEIRAAIEAAHAGEFLDRLPQGLATPLGERGQRLSGGQKQRIAIARAILKNPGLLLLDEATSALDSESERAIQEALDTLMRGRTTLIVAHRLATILKADRIIVMDRGRIDAIGTHAELIAADGLYARLAAWQFDRPILASPDRS